MEREAMETYARVDLAALARNLEAIRSLVNRPILLPVKANAYGHGLVVGDHDHAAAPLAHFVEQRGLVEWLGVATVDEGVGLRDAGVRLPILKFSPAPPDEVVRAIAAGLTLTVTSEENVVQADRAAESIQMPVDVHLKIDTGMRRIGVSAHEAPRVAAMAESTTYVNLTGLFTHFAASEDPAQDEFTAMQIARFNHAVTDVENALGHVVEMKHAANSGAVLRHPDAWYSMVRPGILSYGYASESGAEGLPIETEPVLSLVSHVSFVKTVRKGETVSYGRTWTAPYDTRVATIPIGYGDGYSRRLSNKSSVLVRGRRCPQVGTVCMDQIMVDLGPGSPVDVGEAVVLIGADGDERIGANEIGALEGTISYEVLCAIAERVPRVYVDE